jgi:endonuclease/exonuclease/phosphatase (EEP) superfamily protein YafD
VRPATRSALRYGTAGVLVLGGTLAVAISASLAWLRVSGPTTSWALKLVAFTPLGLPLAVGALLAGVVVGVLLRSWSRVPTILATAFALPLVVLHAWWLAPLWTGTIPAASAGPRLVVMTQNFEEGDPGALTALVRENAVDVLVVTDAPPWQVEALKATGLNRSLRHTTLGNGLDSIVWSRFPILEDTLISDGADSRSVVLDVPDLGHVALVAVHPTPPYQEGGSRWSLDWERLLERLGGAYPAGGEPLVVLGDFNATRDHRPMRELEAMGFRDAGEQLNRGLVATWPVNGKERRLGVPLPAVVPIDHVLTRGDLVPTDMVVSDAVGSDHRAVIATLAPAAR